MQHKVKDSVTEGAQGHGVMESRGEKVQSFQGSVMRKPAEEGTRKQVQKQAG